jgi:hypothetical protein
MRFSAVKDVEWKLEKCYEKWGFKNSDLFLNFDGKTLSLNKNQNP